MVKGQTDDGYRAFISYSHADRRVVEWLHGALEGYRIPSKLVGVQTPLGPVPARLGKLFRDRDELPAAGDLSAELTAALQKSMFLIVVCSPAAAQSRWVNEEVRQFKLLHGPERGDRTARVLALIADGDPGDPGGVACFPPALKFHVLPDGRISDNPAEPVAADIRPGGDGRKLAKLKLVAGLTGLPLDWLVQREAVRRQQRTALLAGASLALTGVMAVLTVLAVQGRREAEQQRAQADGLIEYMLTDLRKKLEPVGRLEVMDSVGQRALSYYAAQDLQGLSPDELGRRARALHLVGEVRDLRGDSDGALKAFREAERTTWELLARDPGNADRMFDHAQSLFWVGQVAWARNDWPTAEGRFRRYAELADAMAATDSRNPKWIAEQAYAANSLGALLLRTGNAPAAVSQFERYVAMTDRLAELEPAALDRQFEQGQANAWLADALVSIGRLQAATEARQRELAFYAGILASDPLHASARSSLVVAQNALADLDVLRGDATNAIQRLRIASDTIAGMTQEDPGNMLWLETASGGAILQTEALLIDGRLEEAQAAGERAHALALRLQAANSGTARPRLLGVGWLRIAGAHASGNRAAARSADAAFRTAFAQGRDRDLAGMNSLAWMMVDTMAALDAIASGDRALADTRRSAALAAAMRSGDPRAQAIVGLLSAPPFEPVEGPAPAGEGRYPADRLFAPIRGP